MKNSIPGFWVFFKKSTAVTKGFSLLEILTTLTVIGILAAVATAAVSNIYGTCCLKAVFYELTGMIKEAKQNALCNGIYYSITFNTASGVISLVSDRGKDGEWNTPDDKVVRSLQLSSKGGGLRFGYGSYGPLKGLAEAPDGVSFPTNNTIICNPELTGTAGSVYIISSSGAAMALKMNSKTYGYFLYRWNGKKWEQM
jgi:prepilin-type N-terminal cleavage/methylation domain-containing protein